MFLLHLQQEHFGFERKTVLGLFYNYENAGKGVAKNGPKKKSFFRFWEIFASKFWKIIHVNLLFLVFSGLIFVFGAMYAVNQTGNAYLWLIAAPVVIGFGPACAASMQVMRKFVIEKPIFTWDTFLKAYKANFRQSLGVGIVDVALICVVAFSADFYYNRIVSSENTTLNYVLIAVTVAIAVYALIANFYIYLEIVSLTLPMRAIIKNALILSVVGLKNNLITLVVTLIFAAAVYLFFPWSTIVLPFAPFGWIGFLIAFNSYPLIQKHIINPFYEARGERNPELPEEVAPEETIFVDRGGAEAEIKTKVRSKGIGKIIK